jgi:hypothetical protein
MPLMMGVPGELVDSVPADVLFGERKAKTSPYDPLLLQLRSAGPGRYLRFAETRARVSVAARAKKLGMKVVFGEQAGVLWVALAKVELATSGHTEKEAGRSPADVMLEAIRQKKQQAGEITTWARTNGWAGAGLTQVDAELNKLARAGKIRLKTASRFAADTPERWELVP